MSIGCRVSFGFFTSAVLPFNYYMTTTRLICKMPTDVQAITSRIRSYQLVFHDAVSPLSAFRCRACPRNYQPTWPACSQFPSVFWLLFRRAQPEPSSSLLVCTFLSPLRMFLGSWSPRTTPQLTLFYSGSQEVPDVQAYQLFWKNGGLLWLINCLLHV